MSLFQCENCGCCENTALSHQGFILTPLYDWSGMEEKRHLKLCSACGPSKYASGDETGAGVWHGEFERVFLPMGMFKTDIDGNLEHIDTGDKDYRKYAVETMVKEEK